MTRFFLGRIYEDNGDYNYTECFLLRANSQHEADLALKRIVKDWYDGTKEKDQDGYYFNGGEIYVGPLDITEITEHTFSELKGKSLMAEM